MVSIVRKCLYDNALFHSHSCWISDRPLVVDFLYLFARKVEVISWSVFSWKLFVSISSGFIY